VQRGGRIRPAQCRPGRGLVVFVGWRPTGPITGHAGTGGADRPDRGEKQNARMG